MESNNNNHALSLFKVLKSMAGPDGEVHVDMHEVCRAADLDETDVKDSIADLERERFIRTELICRICAEWR